jgi:Transposase
MGVSFSVARGSILLSLYTPVERSPRPSNWRGYAFNRRTRSPPLNWPCWHVSSRTQRPRVVTLVRHFGEIVRERSVTRGAEPIDTCSTFEQWLSEARTCGVRAVETFAQGLEQDGDAVRAAPTTSWSNAQSEGQITKLKLCKSQMYGRASCDLLRHRVLLAA